MASILSSNGPIEWHSFHNDFDPQILERDASKQNIKTTPFLQFDELPSFMLVAIPAAFLHEYIHSIVSFCSKHRIPIVSVAKGILKDYQKPFIQCLEEDFDFPDSLTSVLVGPSHAEEVKQDKPTQVAIASNNKFLFEPFRKKIQQTNFTVQWQNNARSLEWASALKNAYAIGSGLLDAWYTSDNLKALFVSKCYWELESYLKKFNETSEHHILGDLLVTAYSKHSRNYRLGYTLASNKKQNAHLDGLPMTPEGYFVLSNAPELPELQIFQAIRRIVLMGEDAKALHAILMR